MRLGWLLAGAIVLAAFLAVVCYSQALNVGLSHDEHQFIAPAVLLAREGLLPYRDVPLFHQPYLVFIDAAVAKISSSPFFAARIVSGTAAFLTGLLLCGCGWLAAKKCSPSLRFWAAASVMLLWLASHLFAVSSGRTWNHDVPALAAVAALALLIFAEKPSSRIWLLAGVFAGVATGGRLTYAPFAAALPLVALLATANSWKVRFQHLALAGLGVFVALLPTFWFFQHDPESYIFGNLEFPRLPLLEADNSRILKTLAPWRKARFFFKEVFRRDFLLLVPALVALILLVRKRRWALLALGAALALGAFAPSRYEIQHFYVFAPVGALFIAWALSFAGRREVFWLTFLAFIALALSPAIRQAPELFQKDNWSTTRVHREGLDLQARVPTGKILTLAPILPLEAGLSIYPQLATGPFAWKFAHLVPADRRKRLGLLASTDDLTSFFQNDPPAAILTGVETPKLEKPLVQFAKKAGFRPEPFGKKSTLWMRP